MDRQAVNIQDKLMEALLEIDTATKRLIEAQTAYSAFCANELALAKEECALIENAALMQAYMEKDEKGAALIDGKDAKLREKQADVIVNKYPDVMVAKAELRNAERKAAQFQAEKEAAGLEYKATTYRLHGLRTVGDLQVSLMKGE